MVFDQLPEAQSVLQPGGPTGFRPRTFLPRRPLDSILPLRTARGAQQCRRDRRHCQHAGHVLVIIRSLMKEESVKMSAKLDSARTSPAGIRPESCTALIGSTCSNAGCICFSASEGFDQSGIRRSRGVSAGSGAECFVSLWLGLGLGLRLRLCGAIPGA